VSGDDSGDGGKSGDENKKIAIPPKYLKNIEENKQEWR
jgi:hypothetical protein